LSPVWQQLYYKRLDNLVNNNDNVSKNNKGKKIIGLYIPNSLVEQHKSELKGYEITKAIVRFPLDKKLPRHANKKAD
jgi:hypothetical protein